MATETDYAWAAGFIEADGCIHLSQRANTRVQVIVVQKDRRPIDRLQRIFDDHSTIGIVRRRGTVTYFRLSFSGQRAETLLLAILPYLDHKRELADLGIQLLARVREWAAPVGRGNKLQEAERNRRLQLVARARVLTQDAERTSEVAPRKQASG